MPTVNELKALCREHGIRGYSNKVKSELILMLEDAGIPVDVSPPASVRPPASAPPPPAHATAASSSAPTGQYTAAPASQRTQGRRTQGQNVLAVVDVVYLTRIDAEGGSIGYVIPRSAIADLALFRATLRKPREERGSLIENLLPAALQEVAATEGYEPRISERVVLIETEANF